MIRDFEFGRKDAFRLTDDLVYYKNIVMTRSTYEKICKAEDCLEDLLLIAGKGQLKRPPRTDD
jgi:hypothetical protein